MFSRLPKCCNLIYFLFQKYLSSVFIFYNYNACLLTDYAVAGESVIRIRESVICIRAFTFLEAILHCPLISNIELIYKQVDEIRNEKNK